MGCMEILKGQFDGNHARLMQLVEKCPEKLWVAKFGGFPLWQQLYHAFGCYEFFMRDKGAAALESPFGEQGGDVLMLKEAPKVLTREEVLNFAKSAKAYADKLIAALSEADLVKKQEALSAVFQAEMTNMDALILLSSHSMYHLGIGDAALRENGIPGIL